MEYTVTVTPEEVYDHPGPESMVPKGYKIVDFRVPMRGDIYFATLRCVDVATTGYPNKDATNARFILEKVKSYTDTQRLEYLLAVHPFFCRYDNRDDIDAALKLRSVEPQGE